METMMITKRKDKAFGKDIYLLGKDKDGLNYWLEAPKWDCGWYWAFGYIETYTNNEHPNRARDIQSHGHFSGFVGQLYCYDFDKKQEVKRDYIHHINENDDIKTALTDKESWELSDLMKSFYMLKDMAEFCGHGNSYLTTTAIDKQMQNQELQNYINKALIPAITKRVIEILTPIN